MRIVGGVAQRLSQPVHGGADAVFKLYDRVIRPKPLAKFFPGNHVPGAIEQHDEDSERLLGESGGIASVLT